MKSVDKKELGFFFQLKDFLTKNKAYMGELCEYLFMKWLPVFGCWAGIGRVRKKVFHLILV